MVKAVGSKKIYLNCLFTAIFPIYLKMKKFRSLVSLLIIYIQQDCSIV